MAASVKIQTQGFCIQYPKSTCRVIFVEDASGKFQFRLSGKDFRFEPSVAIATPLMMTPNALPTVFWNYSNA